MRTRALARVRIPGRLDVRPGRPSRVIDVAHNPLAARAVADALGADRGGRGPRVLLFAAAREKDARSMLRSLAAVTDAAVLVRVDHPRMRTLADLLGLARGLWPEPPVGASTPAEGLRLACARAGRTGQVVVTGSFYLAGALAAADAPAGPSSRRTRDPGARKPLPRFPIDGSFSP
jgi:dihydrofolate synthase/folylpolyglutamate synthase